MTIFYVKNKLQIKIENFSWIKNEKISKDNMPPPKDILRYYMQATTPSIPIKIITLYMHMHSL